VQNDSYGTLDFSSFDDFLRTDNHRFGLFLFEATRGPGIGETSIGIAQRTARVLFAITVGSVPTCYFIDGKNPSKQFSDARASRECVGFSTTEYFVENDSGGI
jgi:hypothetical protein